MQQDRRPRSRFEVIGVALLLVALALLLYRDWARQSEPPPVASVRAGSAADAARRATFEKIYREGTWATDAAGQGTSGGGSTLANTRLYRVFLQDFLRAYKIRSVVDAGCGDWEFSQAMDWRGIDYLGLDIVPSLIEANQRRFGKDKLRFAVADVVRDELPAADLLIIKDVLQHLPLADIARVLEKLPRYRHVLIVNDVDPATLSAMPLDITTGGYRPLDVTRPPFSLPGTKLMAWRAGGAGFKLVVHLERR